MRWTAVCLIGALLFGCDAGGTGTGHDAGRPDADASSRDGASADAGSPVGQPCSTAHACPNGYACQDFACVVDCGALPHCDDRCCAAGQVCSFGACATPGAMCRDPVDCPNGQYCETTLRRCLPQGTGTPCEYHPPVGVFQPQVVWEWHGDPDVLPMHNQVEHTPVVIDLLPTPDGAGIPAVLFIAHTGASEASGGVLRAVRGDTGARIFPAADPGYRLAPGAAIAAAELDPASTGIEIVACSDGNLTPNTAGHVMIIRADGTLLHELMNIPCGYGTAPAIADADGDGTPEIAARALVFHVDGTLLPGFASATHDTVNFSYDSDDFPTFADLDADGRQELVLGNRALRMDGTALWSRTDMPRGYPAVADLNADGHPEVVVVYPTLNMVYALNGQTGATIWGPVDVNRFPTPDGPSGGGPPTVADFNGDGVPDVGTAGGYNYLVLNGHDGVPLWFYPTTDTTSRVTGSSVFDFDGDGRAEAVYADELDLRVFRGVEGTVLYDLCNTSVTLWEYPVIADVNNDDHAEMVVVGNTYYAPRSHCSDGTPSHTGIRVLGDTAGNWVRTRAIWNQHSYHVTNVNDDGSIPAHEHPNWTTPGLNNFRQNVQPGGRTLDAPDLQAGALTADFSMCTETLTLYVRITNRGRAGAPAGIPVSFYTGDAMGVHVNIGRATTTRRLLPGESVAVSLAYHPPAGHELDATSFYVVINDPTDMPLLGLHECNSGNNGSSPRQLACTPPG